MKFSKIYAISLKISVLTILTVFLAYFSACNTTTSPTNQTDEQYMQNVVSGGYSTSQSDDDNLMYNEKNDMDDGGAVGDNGTGGSPIDSLKRWGRVVTNVDVNFSGVFSGDTIYTITITRNITGYYRIIGWKNNQIDSVTKPYTEQLHRIVAFKRVARTPYPRYNWRLFQVSLLSGGTQTPSPGGSSKSQIVAISYSINGGPTIPWTAANGDFTQINFITLRFGGSGIPQVHAGDQVIINVTVNSSETNNYVAWHWARNTFGFHRVPFTLLSSTPYPQGNGYLNTFTKTFNVYSDHKPGVFNGFINASTLGSLYDDDPNQFFSTEVGIPYRVVAY